MEFVVPCLFIKILNSEKCASFQRKYAYRVSSRVYPAKVLSFTWIYPPQMFSQNLTHK